MKPSKQTLSVPNAKAIKDIEKRLAEIECMRKRVETRSPSEADGKPLPRKGARLAH
jgi:hypothetical protein